MPDVMVRTAAASNAGRRGHQEDACVTTRVGDGELLVVADGMGGHAAGEVASALVVEAYLELAGGKSATGLSGDGLERAARTANRRILDHAAGHEEARGLGSTVVAVGIGGHGCVVGHAGDSRACLVTADEVIPLTRDHSAVQDALDAGTLTEGEAATSPYRHAILRNLGDADFPGLEISEFEAPEGSVILLTSDGAHGFLTDAEMLEHLSGTASLEEGLEHLLRVAYHRGSDDNITLVGAEIGRFPRSRVQAQPPPDLPKLTPRAAKARSSSLLVAAALFCVGALGVLGWLLAEQLKAPGAGSAGPEAGPIPAVVETPIPIDEPAVVETEAETPVAIDWATPMPTPIPPAPPEPTPTSTPEVGAAGTSEAWGLQTKGSPAGGGRDSDPNATRDAAGETCEESEPMATPRADEIDDSGPGEEELPPPSPTPVEDSSP